MHGSEKISQVKNITGEMEGNEYKINDIIPADFSATCIGVLFGWRGRMHFAVTLCRCHPRGSCRMELGASARTPHLTPWWSWYGLFLPDEMESNLSLQLLLSRRPRWFGRTCHRGLPRHGHVAADAFLGLSCPRHWQPLLLS